MTGNGLTIPPLTIDGSPCQASYDEDAENCASAGTVQRQSSVQSTMSVRCVFSPPASPMVTPRTMWTPRSAAQFAQEMGSHANKMRHSACSGIAQRAQEVRSAWESVKLYVPVVQVAHVELVTDSITENTTTQSADEWNTQELKVVENSPKSLSRSGSTSTMTTRSERNSFDSVESDTLDPNKNEIPAILQPVRRNSLSRNDRLNEIPAILQPVRRNSLSRNDRLKHALMNLSSPEETPELMSPLHKGTSAGSQETFEASAGLFKASTAHTERVTFCVKCETALGQEVRVVGNVAALGEWDPSSAPAMQWTDGHIWKCTVELEFPPATSDVSIHLQYKYVLMSNNHLISWESCKNRVLFSHPDCGPWRVCNVWGSN